MPFDGRAEKGEPASLRRWLWQSYLRAAIVPLLVIELGFLVVFWASSALVYRQNIAAVRAFSGDYLTDVAVREAASAANNLRAISIAADVLSRQTHRALDGNYDPPPAEKARYRWNVDGAFVTVRDNGTTASFYSGAYPIGQEQIRKVWRLAALDPLMADLRDTQPIVSSIYVNTYDSYNRILPYFDVGSQYAPRMDIRKYNFYYDADAAHNPNRKTVWTDAYIDPAGKGWMISCISPVWRNGKLEAVVGLDVTLATLVNRLTNIALPWDAYAMLVDENGRIVAVPRKGETDLRLKELTDHKYTESIKADTFKPDQFDLHNRADTRSLALALQKSASGRVTLQLDSPHQASFATIPGPNWRLVIIAPSREIERSARELRIRLERIAYFMVAALFVFYVLFFAFLYRRAAALSGALAHPLDEIRQLLDRIEHGRHHLGFAGSRVKELDEVGRKLIATGQRLGAAQDLIKQQDRVVRDALERQRQVNEEQRRFIQIMSHEVRTPLAVISSGIHLIGRKAHTLSAEDLARRTDKLRRAVQRISDLLTKMVAYSGLEPASPGASPQAMPFVALVVSISEAAIPAERLRLLAPQTEDECPLTREGATLSIALRVALDNARHYSPPDTAITVAVEPDKAELCVTVIDQGPGLPPEEMAFIGQRYFRGAAASGHAGAGIGIHVARMALERIGGAFELRPTPTGCQVTIRIPREIVAEGNDG